MIYYYLYRTRNTINNKEYIGVHKTYKLRDGYIGNGIKNQKHAKNLRELGGNSPFLKAVIKYGYNNFIKEVLFHFDTYEEALAKEAELVTIDYVKRKDTCNVKIGGKRGGGAIPTPVSYDVTDKRGNRFTGEKAELFCEINEINYWHFIRMLKGQRKTCKGYELSVNYVEKCNYIIVNLENNSVYKTKNLNSWCKENAPELSCKGGGNHLSRILRGVSQSCQKIWWCCYERDWTGDITIKTRVKLEPCMLVDALGITHTIHNRIKFIEEYNLSKTQFYRLLKGKVEEYKGFKIQKM
jgi:hypothetical protein